MKLLVRLVVNTLAVGITAYLLPNVMVDSIYTAVLVAIVLALINTFLKPLVKILTLPINILTLGLFSIVINGAFILLVTAFVPGFSVNGFLWAVIFSFVLSIVSSVLNIFAK